MTSTTDAYGRAVNAQAQQSSSSYSTASTQYAWSGNYRQVQGTLPCSQPLGSPCPFASATTTKLTDPLGRPYTATDGGGGVVTKTYAQNDVLTVLTPAPANENNKQVQREYDGLGRIKSTCKISPTVSGSVSCGQATNTAAKGILTTVTYSAATGSTTTTATRGVQSRGKTVDALGRVTASTSPETGTVNSFYDFYSACPVGYQGAPGHLAATRDLNGNLLCYAYDSLGRVTGVNANGTTCRHFYYDSSSGYSGTIPTGVTAPTNSAGRMVEAATDSCSSSTLITDEWFSYDKNGHTTDMWEKTPRSTQYYHSTATFFGNGAVNTLVLANPSVYTATYGIDGEGRLNSVKIGSQQIVASTTYNAASRPTNIAIGTSTDQDTYVYDPNTGRMTNWTFQVGATPKTETGALQWNANGTLNNLAITDGFSGGTQTCFYNPSSGTGMGYDDLGRLLNVSCGPNGSIWNQTFSYDQYDNLTKSSSGPGISWNPGYNASNNRYTLASTAYDSNGNVTNDSFNAYAYNEFSKMKSINGSGTNCSGGGQCVTYDAMGRAVEIDSGSTTTEVWYTQLGKTAYMSGATYNYSYLPTPGGATALHSAGGVEHFLHKDWLGNSRVSSGVQGQNVIDDRAFAPYGEIYDTFGSTAANENMFTGDTQDILATGNCCYDTPNRELSGNQGRWLSPDPAGAGWNLYAYVTNPNGSVDPSGLFGIGGGNLTWEGQIYNALAAFCRPWGFCYIGGVYGPAPGPEPNRPGATPTGCAACTSMVPDLFTLQMVPISSSDCNQGCVSSVAINTLSLNGTNYLEGTVPDGPTFDNTAPPRSTLRESGWGRVNVGIFSSCSERQFPSRYQRSSFYGRASRRRG